jgi:alkylation response protein AidB-like acyl-CoA dehydrogenase
MSDVSDMLVQTATKLFEDHCNAETLRLAEEGVWPAELWAALEQTGLTLVSIPEAMGGAGGNLAEAITILRVAGQFAAPLPLAETYLAGWVLAASGASLPSTPLTAAFARTDHGLHFRRSPGGWTISGQVRRIPWAGQAQGIVVLGQLEAGYGLTLLKPDQGTLTSGQNLAAEPRDMLQLEDVEVAEVIETDLTPGWILERGALTRCALMAGALEDILRRSVRYTGERVQFGRPIGRFQAIQHQLALLAGEVAAARAAVEAAAAAAERGQATAAIAAAKIRIGEAAGVAATIAHQVHGAMGFSYEYPLHFYTKRLWAWRDEFGSESEWASWLGHHLASQGAGALWPFLTA